MSASTVTTTIAVATNPTSAPSLWEKLKAWLTQKTTISGIAVLLGDASVVLTGGATWKAELPIAVTGFLLAIMPERSGLIAPTVQLAKDVLVAIRFRSPTAYAAILQDVEAEVAAAGVATEPK